MRPKASVRRATDPGPEEDHSGERRWYLDKRISLDTIIQILGMAVVLGGPFILWGRSMEQAANSTASRVAMIEGNVGQREKFDEQRDAESKRRQQEMSTKIDKIDEKMNAASSEFMRQLSAIQVSMAQLLSSNAKPR